MPCGKSKKKIWDAGEVSEMAAKDEISAAWQRIMRLINEKNEKKAEIHGGVQWPAIAK